MVKRKLQENYDNTEYFKEYLERKKKLRACYQNISETNKHLQEIYGWIMGIKKIKRDMISLDLYSDADLRLWT